MVAFRKLFPVLALLSLILGSAVMASAQVLPGNTLTCTTNAGVPPIVRAEGYSELVGDLLLICSGGTAGTIVNTNIQVFLNTNITSRAVSSGPNAATEALLLIDEPTADTIVLGGNAIQGLKALQGENSIVFPNVSFMAPGTTRTLRITNIRADARALGTSATSVPTQIVEFVSSSGVNSLAINNPQQFVGFVQNGVQFDLRACNGTSAPGDDIDFAQCVSQSSGLPTGDGDAQFSVRFREGFQTAFKPLVGAGQTGNPLPSQTFNSESGFIVPTIGVAGVPAGAATNGTRLAARFNNVPAGVRIFVTTQHSFGTLPAATPPGTVPPTPGATAVLIQTGLQGETAGGVPSQVSGTSSLSCNGAGSIPAAEVQISNGTGVAVWEVVNSDPSVQDVLVFSVGVSYAQNTANNLPGIGQATVTGNFAPFYPANFTPNPAVMGPSLPIPRFIDSPISADAFRIDPCASNLLFPFVTNQAGFDTGIAISNTSRDPFADPTERLQSGTCSLNYYGQSAGGGAAPAAQTTTGNVEPGNQLTFVLSSGGNLGVAGTPGFQGYIIATCRFQYAHGFAFITDGPIGQARVAEGYLALSLDSGLASRGSVGETLSH